MKPSALYTAVIEEAIENGGSLELDFSNSTHYDFFMEQAGGEDYVRQVAPELFCLAGLQRTERYQPSTSNELNLTDTFCGEGLSAKPNLSCSKDGMSFTIHSPTSLSLCSQTEVPKMHLRQSFCNNITKNILKEVFVEISGDHNHFQNQTDCLYEDPVLMETPIRTDCLYSMIDRIKNGNPLLRAKVFTTAATVQSFQDDVDKVTLFHPVISKKRQEFHPNEICISYNRAGMMEDPDYCDNQSLSHGIHKMPVYLPFSLQVSLKNGAYFYETDKTGYFYEKYQPRINLIQILHNDTHLPGGAHLMLPWGKISKDNILVQGYNRDKSGAEIKSQPNSLKITFPEHWTSNFESDAVMDGNTEAELYANLLLNICHPSEKGIIKNFVSIIAQYNKQPEDSSQVKVARVFYQWGCVARDTLLLAPSAGIPAEKVQIGDFLLSSDGNAYPVRDITTGTEEFLLEFKTENHVLRVSKTHTLCMADDDGTPLPMPACDVQPGQYVFEWSSSERKAVPARIKEINSVPYGDTVYNFTFDQETYLIGNGMVIGDQAMQGRYLPKDSILEMKQPTPEMEHLDRQLSLLFANRPSVSANTFQPSDAPESYAMHYFAAKYLLTYNSFSKTEAQDIAAYCQFLADNATSGMIAVDEIPDWINKAGFYRIDTSGGFEVPLIPSAMKHWYASNELNGSYPWFPDDESIGSFRVQEDVLRPFHFFPCQTPSPDDPDLAERVLLDPDKLHKLMDTLAEEVYEEKFGQGSEEPAELSEGLKMKTGFYLHILMDTILHRHFCAKQSWVNMAYREAVCLPDGTHADKTYPPYQDFDDDSAYDESTTYPAALEKIGWTVNETFLQLSCQFPNTPDALGRQSVYSLWDNYSGPNSDSYAYDLGTADAFLKKCMHQDKNSSWSRSPQCERICQNFTSVHKDFDNLKKVWQAAEADMDFHYDADAVFQKITACDTSKETVLEQYANFFHYTKILYDLQNTILEEK
ncbi:MAG TPA: hypothetical protein DCZ40_01610 [Lachnospiraceae bacterium]|nr:hypothetical protein [Lachnospiraceae bacterium]